MESSLMNLHDGQPIEYAGAPLGRGQAVMIMMHGRGASARNILELAAAFGHEEFTYLAPSARGNTWYRTAFSHRSRPTSRFSRRR